MPLELVAEVIDESIRPALPATAASEADHRIANNLMIIAGLIRSQAARLPAAPTLPTAQVRDWLEEMSLRIDAVGRLHALLRADNGTAVVDLASYLREIAQAATASCCHVVPRAVISCRGGDLLRRMAANNCYALCRCDVPRRRQVRQQVHTRSDKVMASAKLA